MLYNLTKLNYEVCLVVVGDDCGVFHTKMSERSADLCRSGRWDWVWDWGSMTGLDMTGAI